MSITFSQKFLSVLVHDLKNPLNVIGLTYRLLEAEADAHGPEFRQDLIAIRDNVAMIDRMLVRLNDYIRLHDDLIADSFRRAIMPFDPRRMLAESLELEAESAEGVGAPAAVLEILETCPAEVVMDQARVRLAISCALRNVRLAVPTAPIRVRAGGRGTLWTIEVIAALPPPPGLQPILPGDHDFDRLVGTPEDRRALDLATASRIASLHGGSLRLDVGPAFTAVVLEWPVRPSETDGTRLAV